MVQKTRVSFGSDVPAGSYECADCGRVYFNQSKTYLPPCPNLDRLPHYQMGWKVLSGQGDKDPK